MTVKKDKAHP